MNKCCEKCYLLAPTGAGGLPGTYLHDGDVWWFPVNAAGQRLPVLSAALQSELVALVTADTTGTLLRKCEGCINAELIVTCSCDDVNGDQSEIVPYITVTTLSLVEGVPTTAPAGTFTDESLTVQYAPVNPVDCETIGTDPLQKQRRIILTGSAWSPAHIVKAYTVRVQAVASAATPPTFKDSAGITTPMFIGESFSFSFDDEQVDITAVVTANAGDVVVITFVEIN